MPMITDTHVALVHKPLGNNGNETSSGASFEKSINGILSLRTKIPSRFLDSTWQSGMNQGGANVRHRGTQTQIGP